MISWYKTEMKIFTKSKVAKAYAKFVLYLCRYFFQLNNIFNLPILQNKSINFLLINK